MIHIVVQWDQAYIQIRTVTIILFPSAVSGVIKHIYTLVIFMHYVYVYMYKLHGIYIYMCIQIYVQTYIQIYIYICVYKYIYKYACITCSIWRSTSWARLAPRVWISVYVSFSLADDSKKSPWGNISASEFLMLLKSYLDNLFMYMYLNTD